MSKTRHSRGPARLPPAASAGAATASTSDRRAAGSAEAPRTAISGGLDPWTWVRTYPVTFLHDVTEVRCDPRWHLLAFATRGQLEVITEEARRFVPPDRAVWVPAGVRHTSVMRAPIAMRSIFVAAAAPLPRTADPRPRTLAVPPLLRELLLQICKLGALDRRQREHRHLALVLFDQLAAAPEAPLELPTPIDARARRFAQLVSEHPGDRASLPVLARRAGASLRTIERCFLVETGVTAGQWRRRVRLFFARQLLEAGTRVTEVADLAGYGIVSAFSQAFSRQFRCPPSRRGARSA
jgi:AraC-like DNA-binding protein